LCGVEWRAGETGNMDQQQREQFRDTARDNWLKIAKPAGALGSFEQGTSWIIQTM